MDDDLNLLRQKIERLCDATSDVRDRLLNCVDVAVRRPADALALSRGIGETLAKQGLMAIGIKPPPTFEACLRELEKPEVMSRGLVPAEIISMLHKIRTIGNKAVHDDLRIEITADDVGSSLRDLLRVARWYFAEFSRGPRLGQVFAPAIHLVHRGVSGANDEPIMQLVTEVSAWSDVRFVRVGLTCGYLEGAGKDLRFSHAFLKALSEESHRAVAILDPSFGQPMASPQADSSGLENVWKNQLANPVGLETMWQTLGFASLLRAKRREVVIAADDLDYFASEMSAPLTHYLTHLSVEGKLVALDSDGSIELDGALLDELYGLTLHITDVRNVKAAIIVSLVRLVEARVAIHVPKAVEARFLLALYLYVVMTIGPYVSAIEHVIAQEQG